MERFQEKSLLLQVAVIVFMFLKCANCHGGNGTLKDTNHQSKGVSNSRQSKQFFFPNNGRLFALHFLVPALVNGKMATFMPGHYTYNSHLPFIPVIPLHGSANYMRSHPGIFFANHANINLPDPYSEAVACKSQNYNNQVGICKPFSECFPMMEIEYGNDDLASPLAEQLILTTNASICSKAETGRVRNVCCSYSPFRNGDMQERKVFGKAESDALVRLPTITQRPPARFVVTRGLREEKMCGRPKSGNRGGQSSSHKQAKITGGVEAKGPFEFPWMAAIFGRNRKVFCGASLITDRFLMSAAHCFATFTGEDIPHLYVHLGDYNLRTTTDGQHEVRKIDKVIINKGFRIETYHNDIALLRLDQPVNFTDRIQPICLPEMTMKSRENQQVIVTGWGRKYRYGTTSDVLRKVQMPVWNHDDCKRVYATFAPGRLLDSHICAGDGRRNKDACLGDSGGPAILWDEDKYVQVGITSWGKGCGNFPGVYTKVEMFLGWITKNLNMFS